MSNFRIRRKIYGVAAILLCSSAVADQITVNDTEYSVDRIIQCEAYSGGASEFELEVQAMTSGKPRGRFEAVIYRVGNLGDMHSVSWSGPEGNFEAEEELGSALIQREKNWISGKAELAPLMNSEESVVIEFSLQLPESRTECR